MTVDQTQQSLQRCQELIEISCELASTLDLDALLQRIVSVATRLVGAEASSILLFDENKQQLFFQTSTDQKNQQTMQGIVVPTESIAGWSALHRQVVISDDVHQDPRYFPKVEDTIKIPTKSLIAIPMIAREKLIGVLEVINKETGHFTEDDRQTLSVLGTQAAIAIENSHLFQQSDLIADLVHELRTPLSSISTIAYLLQRPEISEQQRTNLAQTILQESQRLNELVSSFLDLARLESGRAEFHWSDVDLCSLLESCRDVIQFKASEKKIEIQLDLDRSVPPIKADRDKIKQVIFNLLSNAVKYNRVQGKVVVHLCKENNELVITIEDSGYGISAEDLPHIFEKFYRSATSERLVSGTGLGLSICKKIMNGHHGDISVSSTPGIGSAFTLRLPIR